MQPGRRRGSGLKPVAVLFERIQQQIHKFHTRAALHDSLLPKLLTGEIWMPEAERTVEATRGD